MFLSRTMLLVVAASTAPWTTARAQTVLTVNDLGDLPDYDLTNGNVDANAAMPGEQRTLRACIEQACTWGGAYRIVLPAQTIFLTNFGADDACHWGDLDIFGANTMQMTIEGVGGATVLDASGFGTLPATADRVFDVQPNLPNGALLEIKDLRIQLGSRPNQNGGGIRHSSAALLELANVEIVSCSSGNGGGVYAAGPLHMSGCLLSQCTATIDGGGLHVAAPASADLDLAQLLDNTATQFGGGIFVASGASLDATGLYAQSNDATEGGCVRSRGATVLTNCALYSSTATAAGGNVSIKSPGSLTMSTCTLGGGSASEGGGLYIGTSVTASVVDTSLELNVATGLGGGLSNQGTTTVARSTFSDNTASSGGGANNFHLLSLRNCTLSANRATNYGGGLYLSGLSPDRATIDACTIAGNQAAHGGGAYLEGLFGAPTNEIGSSFLADNRSTLTGLWENSAGTLAWSSHCYNVDTDGTCGLGACSISGTIAMPLSAGLGPLAFNGGPTRTQALTPCSAAQCAGSTAYIDGTSNTFDQRGLVRGSPPDAGAFDEPAFATVVYCTAGTTSNGCVPSITATGIASSIAPCNLTLTVTNLEGQKQTVLFYGVSGPAALPWGSGSTSFLCVKAPTQRMGALNSGGTAGSCNGAVAVNWSSWIAGHPGALGAPFVPGQSIFAQAWFRDPPAPKTTNLSDAVTFPVCP